MQVIATLGLDLVTTDATRDRGIGHGSFQPPLGRTTPYEGVLCWSRFDPVVPAVGITAAVEVCIARDAGVYLRKRKVF
jgi:hypothetical protein